MPVTIEGTCVKFLAAVLVQLRLPRSVETNWNLLKVLTALSEATLHASRLAHVLVQDAPMAPRNQPGGAAVVD